jgi:hypothetical protein
MPAKEESCGECVASACRAADVSIWEADTGMFGPSFITAQGATSFREMDDDTFTDPGGKKIRHRLAQSDPVKLFPNANFVSSDSPGLKFVHHAQIDVGEGWADDFSEPIAVFADNIDGGAETRGLGASQNLCGNGAMGFAWCVHSVKEQEVTEVKDFRRRLGKVEMRAAEECVCAAGMEEGAAAGPLNRHDIGVTRGCLLGLGELMGANSKAGAISYDFLSVFVLADESGCFQGEGGSHKGEIHEDIVGGASRAMGTRENICKRVLRGPSVDDFDVVDDPVAACENTVTGSHKVW